MLTLKKLLSTRFHEKYNSGDYNYIVGKVNLQTLLTNSDYILKNKLFISLVNDKISLNTKKTNKVEIKEKELINN